MMKFRDSNLMCMIQQAWEDGCNEWLMVFIILILEKHQMIS